MKLRERSPLLWKQRGYIGIGNRRVMGSMNARRRLEALLDGSQFYAPRTSSITQTRGSGTPTIVRATPATVMGYAPTAVLADGQTLLTVASGELRHQGARRISEGVWSTVDADGVQIPAATLDGSVVEAAATQYLGVTGTPATQTTASLGTGTYTLWCEGTGSCIASAGTATITGAAAASAGAPDQFEVTVAGTVTVTVTGSLTTFNLTNTPYQTSYIANTGAAGTSTTRNKDVLDDQVSGNLTAAAGSVAFQWTPSHAPSGTVALCGSYVDASNYTMLLAQKVTNLASNPTDFSNASWTKAGTCTVTGTNVINLPAVSDYIAKYSLATALAGKSVRVQCKMSGTGTIFIGTYNNVGSFQLTAVTLTATPTVYYSALIAINGAAADVRAVIARNSGTATSVTATEFMIEDVTNNASQFAAPYTATTDTFAILRKVIAGAAYDAYIQHAYVSGTTYDVALKWGANGSNLDVDGVLGTANANGTAAQLGTRWQWGADGNGGQQAGAAIKEKFMWTRSLSDSELQAVTL